MNFLVAVAILGILQCACCLEYIISGVNCKWKPETKEIQGLCENYSRIFKSSFYTTLL